MRSAVVCCFLAPAVALVTRLSPDGASCARSRRPSSLRALPAGAAPAASEEPEEEEAEEESPSLAAGVEIADAEDLLAEDLD